MQCSEEQLHCCYCVLKAHVVPSSSSAQHRHNVHVRLEQRWVVHRRPEREVHALQVGAPQGVLVLTICRLSAQQVVLGRLQPAERAAAAAVGRSNSLANLQPATSLPRCCCQRLARPKLKAAQ